MLEQRLNDIRTELDSFDDEFTKYSFLVELSAYVSPSMPDIMVDEYLQRGCQSQVWMRLEEKDGCLYLRATSDTLIIRGLLYVMGELFCGVPVEEFTAFDGDLLDALGIKAHFSDTRQSGVASIVSSIVGFCRVRAAGCTGA
jgi:cysteine desulfuration protein SufE